MLPSCAVLGGFAIGARVALLWQHNANPSYKLASTPRYDNIVRMQNVSECSVLALCLVTIIIKLHCSTSWMQPTATAATYGVARSVSL